MTCFPRHAVASAPWKDARPGTGPETGRSLAVNLVEPLGSKGLEPLWKLLDLCGGQGRVEGDNAGDLAGEVRADRAVSLVRTHDERAVGRRRTAHMDGVRAIAVDVEHETASRGVVCQYHVRPDTGSP